MDVVFTLILWVAGTVVAGIIAERKGRNGGGYAVLALLLSPIVGIGLALAVAPNVAKAEQRLIEAGTVRRCPHCLELVKLQAVKCRHCLSNLEPPAAQHGTATKPVSRMEPTVPRA